MTVTYTLVLLADGSPALIERRPPAEPIPRGPVRPGREEAAS